VPHNPGRRLSFVGGHHGGHHGLHGLDTMEPEQAAEDLKRVRHLLAMKLATASCSDQARMVGGCRSQQPPSHEVRLQYLFIQSGADNAGTLCYEDYKKFVRKQLHISNRSCTDQSLMRLFRAVDSTNSGRISWQNLFAYLHERDERGRNAGDIFEIVRRAVVMALLRKHVRGDSALMTLFNKFDVDSDKTMSLFELHTFCRSVEGLNLTKHELTEKNIRTFFHALDDDSSGKVDMSEFMTFLKICLHHMESFVPRVAGQRAHSKASVRLPSMPAESGQRLQWRFDAGDVLRQQSKTPAQAAQEEYLRLSAETDQSTQQGKDWPQSPSSLKLPEIGPSNQKTSAEQLHYLKVDESGALTRIEKRLFESGVDMRGKFFKEARKLTNVSAHQGGGVRGGRATESKVMINNARHMLAMTTSTMVTGDSWRAPAPMGGKLGHCDPPKGSSVGVMKAKVTISTAELEQVCLGIPPTEHV